MGLGPVAGVDGTLAEGLGKGKIPGLSCFWFLVGAEASPADGAGTKGPPHRRPKTKKGFLGEKGLVGCGRDESEGSQGPSLASR